MRGLVCVIALSLCATLSCGCAQRHDAQTAQVQPAPSNPDLGAVLERYYGQIQGRHWSFAYAMLSPRLRATLPESAFEARYADLTNADVTVGQSAGLRLPVRLDDTAHHTATTETVTLAWNGEDWTIDRLDRGR
jgi:hypothetical protein